MKLLTISVPPGARILYNSLFEAAEVNSLTQDVLVVAMPNDIFIDVGWYPEYDPNGQYRISVYQGDWENQLLAEPIRTGDPHDVAGAVSRLAVQFTGQAVEST